MTDDDWVTLEEAKPGPVPISVWASKRDREEFGGKPVRQKTPLIWDDKAQAWR